MDLFVIHSNSDSAAVEEAVARLQHAAFNVNALILKNGGKLWKIDAQAKIKKAQLVVFFNGKTSYQSPYIGWELKESIRRGKRIISIPLDDACQVHPALLITDGFSGTSVRYDQPLSLGELETVIRNYESGSYNIFNTAPDDIDSTLLLEQYKIFLQTSETLVSRRQSVNSFYITVNSAIVALYSVVLALNSADTFKLIVCIVFALLGIVLCLSWMSILVSYGNLNSSKMKIISSIEKQLPASLYDAEWAALSDKLNKKRYVSFTDSEKRIPVLFIIIYLVFLTALVVLLVGGSPF